MKTMAKNKMLLWQWKNINKKTAPFRLQYAIKLLKTADDEDRYLGERYGELTTYNIHLIQDDSDEDTYRTEPSADGTPIHDLLNVALWGKWVQVSGVSLAKLQELKMLYSQWRMSKSY